MTSLVDVAIEVPGNLDTIERELRDAVTNSKTQETKPKTADETVDDEIPVKLRGKSLTEIADMYRNLEAAHGRMANDLGAQRQLSDRLLELKRNDDLGQNTPPKKPEKVNVTAADLLEKPTEALERFADSREAAVVAQVNDRLNRVEAALVQREFAAKHPDANTVAQSPEFIDWVKASPVRQRAANAAVQGHFGAADDLLTEFKAIKPVKVVKEEDDKQKDNLDAARNASLDGGGAGGPDPGNKKSGKVYSRSDLMRLRIEKPETYYNEDFQQEITIAYAQGRVK